MWAHFEIRMFSSRHMKYRTILVHFVSFPRMNFPALCIYSHAHHTSVSGEATEGKRSNMGMCPQSPLNHVVTPWGLAVGLGITVLLSMLTHYTPKYGSHGLQSWATVVNSCKLLCPETRQRKHLRIQMGKSFWVQWSNVLCQWQDYITMHCIERSHNCATCVCLFTDY